MSETFQLKGCTCEPCSDIPLNWNDMRSVFGYTALCEIVLENRKEKGGRKCLKYRIL